VKTLQNRLEEDEFQLREVEEGYSPHPPAPSPDAAGEGE
jgi:hypothetical protein